jgi:MoxR-like ATPase
METVDDETTAAAIDFMQRQVRANKPFFTWMNTTRMHAFTHVRESMRGQSGMPGNEYADGMIEHDGDVGKLLKAIDELGIANNTIVVYSTDNGPNQWSWPDAATTPFRSEKDTNWEGAFRVPAMIRWPGRIKAGEVSNEMISGLDWFPTLVAAAGDADIKDRLVKGTNLAGRSVKVHLDGYNQLPYLTGQAQKSARNDFYYFNDDGEMVAYRYGDWKIVFCEQRKPGGFEVWSNPFTCLRAPKVFNLRMDPFERADIVSDQYYDWLAKNAYLLQYGTWRVAPFLQTFKEFPPSQRSASFSIDQMVESLMKDAGQGSHEIVDASLAPLKKPRDDATMRRAGRRPWRPDNSRSMREICPISLQPLSQRRAHKSEALSAREALFDLKTQIGKSVLGQDHMVESMLIGLLANGNLLIESLPGLAKTRAVKTLAKHLAADLSRVQFTPDLLPSDVTGAEIYVQTDKGGQFQFQKGPIFANLVLADEINRAPAKVQSALLEAMEERQVTVAGKTYKMPDLFMVLATENPIEQEGTYPLPEAQLDRFLMHVVITYPDEATEGEIIKLNREENAQKPKDHTAEPAPVPQQAILDARGEIDGVFVSDLAQKYIVDIIYATRFPGRYGDPLGKWIQVGASPRGSLALDRCARVRAWLDGQEFVTPDHVRAVMHDCLRHRLILSYEAVSQGINADQVIDKITELVSAA